MNQDRKRSLTVIGLGLIVTGLTFNVANCVSPEAVVVKPGAVTAKADVDATIRTAIELALNAALVAFRQELKASAAHSTGSEAGRDSTVWNITLQNVAGKAGWLVVPTIAAGWWASKRRTVAALDTVIASIEQKKCQDCKRCVELKNNPTVNERVAVVSAKLKNGH